MVATCWEDVATLSWALSFALDRGHVGPVAQPVEAPNSSHGRSVLCNLLGAASATWRVFPGSAMAFFTVAEAT